MDPRLNQNFPISKKKAVEVAGINMSVFKTWIGSVNKNRNKTKKFQPFIMADNSKGAKRTIYKQDLVKILELADLRRAYYEKLANTTMLYNDGRDEDEMRTEYEKEKFKRLIETWRTN